MESNRSDPESNIFKPYYEIIIYFLKVFIQTCIFVLGYDLSHLWFRCVETKRRQLIGLWFWSSRRNPITALLGDQRDYRVSKEKQSEPIWFQPDQETRPCNEVSTFPPFSSSHLFIFLPAFLPYSLLPLLSLSVLWILHFIPLLSLALLPFSLFLLCTLSPQHLHHST